MPVAHAPQQVRASASASTHYGASKTGRHCCRLYHCLRVLLGEVSHPRKNAETQEEGQRLNAKHKRFGTVRHLEEGSVATFGQDQPLGIGQQPLQAGLLCQGRQQPVLAAANQQHTSPAPQHAVRLRIIFINSTTSFEYKVLQMIALQVKELS